MSVLGIFAPVTGAIKLHTRKFNVISEGINLQNVNGTKNNRLAFSTLVGERNVSASDNVAHPSGIRGHIRHDVSAQGALYATGRTLDLGINGHGFIPVRADEFDDATGEGTFLMTRNGKLHLRQAPNPTDPNIQDHLLVDSDGHYVQGWTPDANGQFPAKDFDNLGRIQLNPETLSLTFNPTSQINLNVNLPHDTDLLQGAQYPQTLSIYDNNGNERLLNLQFEYSGIENQWNLAPSIVNEDGQQLGETVPPFVPITFDSNGRLPIGSNIGLQLDFGGGNTAQINVDYSDSTSYGESYVLQENSQNGYPVGTLQSYEITNRGIINGIFSNGRNSVIAQIPLVDVANRNVLDSVSSGSGPKYRLSEQNMELQIYDLNEILHAQYNSGSLESSTIELSTAFTDMIETQHSYSLNNNSLQILNDMAELAANLKR